MRRMLAQAFASFFVPFMKNSTVIDFISFSSRILRSKKSLCDAVSDDDSPEPCAPEKCIDDVLAARIIAPIPSIKLPPGMPGTTFEYSIVTMLAVEVPTIDAPIGFTLKSPSKSIHARVSPPSAARASASDSTPAIRNSCGASARRVMRNSSMERLWNSSVRSGPHPPLISSGL